MSDHPRDTDPASAPSQGDGLADGEVPRRAGDGSDAHVDAISAIYGPALAPPAAGEARRAGRWTRRRDTAASNGNGNGNGNGTPSLTAIDGGGEGGPPAERKPRPKIKWFRIALLVAGLGILAVVSTVFGMMMAVASDLPEIDVLDVASRQSTIVDRNGKDLGILTGNTNRLLVRSGEIAPVMKHAIVSIEDRRFYTNSGVDLRGITRALWQDVITHHAAQGGSTIAQQLVKNRLEAQNDRTIFQKLREAAMAFHMTRKWDKERILRNYLNTIYFGNGAYGIEAAARTYFGHAFGLGTADPLCGSGTGERRCASLLEPAQAALIAGIVSSPSGYDPVTHPSAAKARRNLVLLRMYQQNYVTKEQYDAAVRTPLPTRDDVEPPQETSKYPYFTTWVRQQVVDAVGAGKAFEGGLKVRTTLDSELQASAQNAITQWLGPHPGTGGVPAAGLVALDNRTSEVLAMVGGNNDAYNLHPFNLATQGQRQPGSSFKPFILAEALEKGYTQNSMFTSRKKDFCVTHHKGQCVEHFVVNNYDDAYSGVTNLANATAFSDNSVYAELGLRLGTKRIAHLARRMGIRTPVSSNSAMTLGGLSQGVTVLDMAHAYETLASGGNLIYGSLSPGVQAFQKRGKKGTTPGPVGIKSITQPSGSRFVSARLLSGGHAVNHRRVKEVLPASVAHNAQSILEGVPRIGSGKRASLGPDIMVAGKTGTTEDYGDAWFVGWTPRYTVAVWVGYPDSVKSMKPPTFSFNGEPVAGGTYPAAIWGTFMRQAMTFYEREHPNEADKLKPETSATPTSVTPAPGATGGVLTAVPTAAPTTPAPAPPTNQTPQTPDTTGTTEKPAPATPAPDTGTGTTGTGGTGGGTGAPSTGTGTGTGAGTGTG